jgi:hypothetical protein
LKNLLISAKVAPSRIPLYHALKFLFKNYLIATYSGNTNPLSINYNSLGIGNLQLPQGPQSDSYHIYLSVNIFDDTNGVTTYSLSNPVVVLPNTNLLSDSSTNLQLMLELNSGNVNLVARNSIAMASGLNMQFNSSQSSASQTSQVTALKELLVNKVASLSVSDSNSISTLATALSTLTQVPDQVSTRIAVKNLLDYCDV